MQSQSTRIRNLSVITNGEYHGQYHNGMLLLESVVDHP